MLRVESENNSESIMKWFEKEVEDGENSILVYPNLQTFRQIYTKYVKDQLAVKEEEEEGEDNNNSRLNTQSKSRRIILIATYYETVDSVKHHLSAFGVKNLQRLMDDGSLVTIDAFHSYFPDINGMKKLVDSLSHRARKEGRDGVTAIVDMGSFFLNGGDGKATELINYETSLSPKTQDGNVRGFSCYHVGNYNTLTDTDKVEISQRQKKKLLEITAGTITT